MHATDLYLILFSYLRNQKIYCLDVYTLAKERETRKIFSRKTGYSLNKMSYREFESWWEERQWYDSSLLNPKELYGIRLVFVPALVEALVRSNGISLSDFYFSYKPAYPWSSDIIGIFDFYYDESNAEVFWELTPKYKYAEKPVKRPS